MKQTTKHGYTIYPANDWRKNPYMFCRDDENALADIRALIEEGKTIEVHNGFDTFYGCGWGDWLTNGVEDIADAKVTEMQDSRGYGPDFPGAILLTPKTAK